MTPQVAPDPPKPKQTVEQMMSMAAMLNAAWGGKVVKKEKAPE
jgi:hypothetical protein